MLAFILAIGAAVIAVHAVGGRLQVSSPPGGGTRLRAELPTNVLGSLDGH